MPIPHYWTILLISKKFLLVKLHLEVSSVKGESTLLPLILKLTVVALGFASRRFQKKLTNNLNQIYLDEMSKYDLQKISVVCWSGPAILLSRNILLVCTQRCPQLYTHRDPAIWTKKRKLTPSRWFYLIAIIVGLAIGLVLTQVPNPPRLACACAPLFNDMVTTHLARLWYSFVIF